MCRTESAHRITVQARAKEAEGLNSQMAVTHIRTCSCHGATSAFMNSVPCKFFSQSATKEKP